MSNHMLKIDYSDRSEILTCQNSGNSDRSECHIHKKFQYVKILKH